MIFTFKNKKAGKSLKWAEAVGFQHLADLTFTDEASAKR